MTRSFVLLLLAVTPAVGLADPIAFAKPPAWASGEIGEPVTHTIDDRTLVYYSARKKNGPMCIGVADAKTPGGPFVDHGPITCTQPKVSFGAVDPFVLDDGGTRWLVWKEDGSVQRKTTPLLFQELRRNGLALVGDARELFANDTKWEGNTVSSPALVRHGEWLYAFYTGNETAASTCTAIGVARAPQIQGPWTKSPTNPLIATTKTHRCPAQPTIASTPAQQITYRVTDGALVAPLTFGKDGWPIVGAYTAR